MFIRLRFTTRHTRCDTAVADIEDDDGCTSSKTCTAHKYIETNY